jgi:hypothetical protein
MNFDGLDCSKTVIKMLFLSLGQDIKELFLDIALVSDGSSILNFSYPICEEDFPKFSFCGRRKGGKLSALALPLTFGQP